MSKKTKIILGVIGGLLLLLVLQKTVKFSSVPGVKPWKENADEIVLKNKTDAEIKISKKDGQWIVGDKAFPADAQAVAELERKMKELKLSEAVTEKGYYERFQLTDDSGIHVTVKSSGKVLRDILIGKASMGDQTYIKFTDKAEVYLAPGGLAHEFNKKLDDLRSKFLHPFTRENIESFSIKGKFTVEKKFDKPADPKASASPSVGDNMRWVIKESGAEADSDKMAEYLGELYMMRALGYPEESVAKSIVSAGIKSEVVIKANGKEITISIYGKEKQQKPDQLAKYICRSSDQNYYVFADPARVEKFLPLTVKDVMKKK